MNVSRLVSSLGDFAAFGLVAAESPGVPLPGEAALIVAGADAGQTHHLDPWVIFAVAAATAIAGDNAGLWIRTTAATAWSSGMGARSVSTSAS